jgi:DNA-binding transcriptional MerR regulator
LIKEAAAKLGIPAHTIRYYEKEGLLPSQKRDEQGNRIFEPGDLNWISLMTCFRSTGMPVAALKQIVELATHGNSTIPQRQAILEAHKQELQRRQEELDRAFEAVNLKLARYESITAGMSDPDLGNSMGNY